MRSISIIVTAMNEQGNLGPTIESVLSVVGPRSWDYEIVIVDDGSTDRTGAIADKLASSNDRIRVHHHSRNLGLDRAYLKGIELATKEHIAWVAGNNIISADALGAIYGRIDDADMVISYPFADVRGAARRSVSRAFTAALNVLFGVRLKYYTGPCVYRADVVKGVRTITRGSMIVPEILLRMIKLGETYVEVGLDPKPRTSGRTKTFRPSNIVYVTLSIAKMFIDIQVLGRFNRPGAVVPGVARPNRQVQHNIPD
jgi:dolichol-phosphate mannosyltransferase